MLSYILSFFLAASIVLGDSLLRYWRTPNAKLMKYSSHFNVLISILNSCWSIGVIVLINANVLVLWNFHSVKMNFSNIFNDSQTFVCNRTSLYNLIHYYYYFNCAWNFGYIYIGRPPAIFVKKSRIYAGKKCTNIAEILNNAKLDTNFRCGYQTADFSGYKCSNWLVLSATWSHWNGLHVDEVQWKMLSSPDLSKHFLKTMSN